MLIHAKFIPFPWERFFLQRLQWNKTSSKFTFLVVPYKTNVGNDIFADISRNLIDMLCIKYKTFYILTLATCAVDAQLTSNLVRGSGWTFPNCRIAKSTLYKSSLQKRKRKKKENFHSYHWNQRKYCLEKYFTVK